MTIHSSDPFEVPLDQRDPVRRLRGRLVAPVTILTAQADRPVGLTVSSVSVVEGDAPRVIAILGAGSEFMAAAERSGKFVVHVLSDGDATLADVFAGLRPAPGGMFHGRATEASPWGPRLTDVADWAGCRLEEIRELGDQLIVVGIIEDLAVSDLSDPLIYFRGEYRAIKR